MCNVNQSFLTQSPSHRGGEDLLGDLSLMTAGQRTQHCTLPFRGEMAAWLQNSTGFHSIYGFRLNRVMEIEDRFFSRCDTQGVLASYTSAEASSSCISMKHRSTYSHESDVLGNSQMSECQSLRWPCLSTRCQHNRSFRHYIRHKHPLVTWMNYSLRVWTVKWTVDRGICGATLSKEHNIITNNNNIGFQHSVKVHCNIQFLLN